MTCLESDAKSMLGTNAPIVKITASFCFPVNVLKRMPSVTGQKENKQSHRNVLWEREIERKKNCSAELTQAVTEVQCVSLTVSIPTWPYAAMEAHLQASLNSSSSQGQLWVYLLSDIIATIKWMEFKAYLCLSLADFALPQTLR